MAGVKGRSGGRNAKTVAEHKRKGTYDPTRHKGYQNPEPPKGVPEPPKALEGDALEEWGRMVTRLTQSGILSVVDDGALYQYCRLFAETEAIATLQLEVAGSSLVVEENLRDLKGAELVQAFQEITKLRALEARYTTQIRQGRMAQRTYLVEFGLTPAARGRVKVPEKPEEDADSFAAFQNQKPRLERVK